MFILENCHLPFGSYLKEVNPQVILGDQIFLDNNLELLYLGIRLYIVYNYFGKEVLSMKINFNEVRID